MVKEIMEYGRWAPSGLNNQPWKVNIVSHPTIKRMLSEFTEYGAVIGGAFLSIVVFYDVERGYDKTKDLLAIGAFMQNILLGVNAMNKFGEKIGAVWLGEILNKKEEVNELFKLDLEKFELMGVIAVGYLDEQQKDDKERERRAVDDFSEWY